MKTLNNIEHNSFEKSINRRKAADLKNNLSKLD